MAGRPTEYKPEFNSQAYQQARNGATDIQIASFFQVSRQTLMNWKKEYPEFREQIELGKAEVDVVMERSLYESALGFTYTETRVKDCDGKITKTTLHRYSLPNVGAMQFWLCNRQPKYWGRNPKYTQPKEEKPRQIYKIGETKVEF